MKSFRILILFFASIWFGACQQAANHSTDMAQLNVSITGMTCEHGCKKAIEKKVAGLEGVSSIKIDFEQAKATIAYHSDKIKPEEIIASIGSIGGGLYTAVPED